MNKLMIRLDKCTGCKRCEQACIAEHTSGKKYIGAVFSTNEPGTSIFVEATGEKAVPIVCRHCVEPLCVSACMSGCMQKDPVAGVVTNTGHEQKCVGCWMCIMACPFGVISPRFNERKTGGAPFSHAVKCDFCPERDSPACADACPNRAIEVMANGN